MLPEDLGTRIRQQRVIAALTQEQLAEMSGITVETLSRLERGKNFPHPSTIQKIARALNLPPQYFTRPMDDREL